MLEEVGSEMSRTQSWLQDDQRRFWETELRTKETKLFSKLGAKRTANMELSGIPGRGTNPLFSTRYYRAYSGEIENDENI